MISRFPTIRLRLAPLFLALAFAACSSSQEKPKIDENAFPADYRNAVLTTVMTTKSFDPTNIREASISEPALRPVAGETTTRYVLCVRFNPRDLARQYTGLTDYIVYFYAGDITQFVKASRDQCAWATYKPFPELEKICLSEKDKCR